jgi:hypothetical protein
MGRSDNFAMEIDRTLVPCGICGVEVHDYEAKAACLLPNNGKPRDEFVCDGCYKMWRDGELDG